MAYSAGLTRFAATVDVDLDVEGFDVVGQEQRLLDDHDRGLAAEVLLDRLAVDRDLTTALLDEHARHRRLAAAGPVIPIANHRRSLDFQSLGALGGVRVRGTGINLQLLDHRVAQRTLGQHALDGLFQGTAGMLGLHVLELGRVDPARETRVTVVHLVGGLVARDTELFGIDDDDEVAGIDVRRVDWLVLATQTEGHFAGNPSEDLVGRVNHKPLVRHFGRFGAEGFHDFETEWKSRLESLSRSAPLVMPVPRTCRRTSAGPLRRNIGHMTRPPFPEPESGKAEQYMRSPGEPTAKPRRTDAGGGEASLHDRAATQRRRYNTRVNPKCTPNRFLPPTQAHRLTTWVSLELGHGALLPAPFSGCRSVRSPGATGNGSSLIWWHSRRATAICVSAMPRATNRSRFTWTASSSSATRSSASSTAGWNWWRWRTSPTSARRRWTAIRRWWSSACRCCRRRVDAATVRACSITRSCTLATAARRPCSSTRSARTPPC
eukprot:Opistho-1_new@79282